MLKFIIARHDKKIYNEYIKTSLDILKEAKTYDVFDSEGEHLSLTKKYNLGIEKAIKDNLQDDEPLIFVHEDIKILDQYFEEKVNLVFQNKNIGILGVIGCLQFNINGMWWANEPNWLFGHCMQEYEKGKTKHLIKGDIGYCEDIVAIDGLIIIVKGKILKDGLRFDENFNFNFYDINLCFDLLYKTNYKIAIADMLVLHKSEGLGSLTKEWHKEKNETIKKYKKLGFRFPISVTSFREKDQDKLYEGT